MCSVCHSSSAFLVAGAETPLQLGKDYLLHSSGGIASGYIRSITRRLPSPFVPSCVESLLQVREMAYVEITMRSAELSNRLVHRMQEIAVLEPGTKEAVGGGLLISNAANGHRFKEPVGFPGLTVWLTGLSGAGKTTIAWHVAEQLRRVCPVELLDGDVVRRSLCKDLGYSKQDRDENVRRLGFVAELLTRKGIVVLITAIAPYRAARDAVRNAIGRFVEVYVNAPIAVCEERDVKGLYKRARAGEIPMFTGIDDPYEAPLAPEVECHTESESIELSVSKVIAAIEQRLQPRRCPE